MMDKDRIIYEDEYLLIYNKPAGLAVQTKKVTEPDLESEIKGYLYKKCGTAPYLGLVHRLDQPVEGLVIFAKDKKSAGALSRMVNDEKMEKGYLAVVSGRPEKDEGRLSHYITRDGRTNMAAVSEEGVKGAALSELYYKVLKTGEAEGKECSLLDIRLFTGRHHQIRVQLSHMGWPILGDKKYNKDCGEGRSFPALAAYSLTFPHPVTGKKVSVRIFPENPIYGQFLVDSPADNY